jgi:hypothetical protein
MRKSILCVLIASLCLTLPVFGQKVTGTIRGIVTDPTGAVVPNAQVTAKNVSTGEERNATSNSAGEYSFPELTPGTYDVSVTGANFKEFVAKGVQLNVSSTSTVNASLQMGNASEQVTVEANAVQVETTSGAVGNVVEGNQVRELPLNGRSFAQLTQLMPGVSPASNFDSKHKGLEAGVDFSVNGNNTTGNIFLVDGVNNNDIGSNRTILVYPSIDAIQEFKILRNSYGPEYGQAMGAIINIVTRGGTNQFHGGAFYFGRNDALNATDYFNNLNNAPKDKLRRNDWGYNIGGPIMKDKLFFFFSEEWNRELRGKLRSANVPTVAEKAGDFSQLRPGCENAPTIGGNVVTAVPAGQLSPTGQSIVAMFPDPNVANPVNCNNWVQSLTAPVYWREENIRMDYRLGKTWSLMGRYTQDHWSQPFPSTLGFWGDDRYPSVEGSWTQPGYQATIKLTKLIGSTAVNDFQFSYAANRITVDRSGTNPGLNDQINSTFQTYFPKSDKFLGGDVGYPVFWGGLGNGANSDNLWEMGPWHNNEALYIVKDDFSKVHGAHTFKVGFLGSVNRKNELSGGSSAENPNYWGANANNTNNGTFNALWNQVTWGFGETQTNPFANTRWKDIEFYYGDTWKLRRNLTLEYGARWSLLRMPYSATDRISSWQIQDFNPALGADGCNGITVVPGTDPCSPLGFQPGTPSVNRSLKENNNHAIAPRVGIAWDPKGDGKMSFRAGVGQFYQRERITNYLVMATNSPFSASVGGSRLLDGAVPQGSLTTSASPSWGLDPSNKLPNTWQYNITFERELYRDTKLELAYVANRGLHILRYRDANPVLPQNRLAYALNNTNSFRPAGVFGSINYAEWTAGSNYNALQALYRTRVKSLDAQFAYTWSKSLADTDITNSGNISQTSIESIPGNARFDYGPTLINRPQVFTSNLVYDLPGLVGHSAPMRYALGGWEVASILQYASGPSTTIFSTNTVSGAPGGISGTGTPQGNIRPNWATSSTNDCRAHGGPKYQWFDPNLFTLDNFQLGGFGNERIGSCSGPGIANTDFSVYKNFKVTERVTVQFRMEFFNVFNKTQFRADQINLNLNSGAQACTGANVTDPTSVCFNHAVNTVGYSFAGNGSNIPAYGQANFGQAGSNGTPGDRGPREIQYALKINF